jgi:hypothetical protein
MRTYVYVDGFNLYYGADHFSLITAHFPLYRVSLRNVLCDEGPLEPQPTRYLTGKKPSPNTVESIRRLTKPNLLKQVQNPLTPTISHKWRGRLSQPIEPLIALKRSLKTLNEHN